MTKIINLIKNVFKKTGLKVLVPHKHDLTVELGGGGSTFAWYKVKCKTCDYETIHLED